MVAKMVKGINVGTNLAIWHVLMTVMSGRMLGSRGGLIPALSASGLDQAATVRAWRGAGSGVWQANEMLKRLKGVVAGEGEWEALKIGGRAVKAYDTVGIFRPRLQGEVGMHYDSQAGKALPAITFGIVGAIGKVKEQPVTLPLKIVRGEGKAAKSDDVLMKELIEAAASEISQDDVVTADRKFSPIKLLENGCKAIVIRRPKNMTLRRSEVAAYKGRGRKPTQGEVVRPFARTYKNNVLPATRPDETQTWTEMHNGQAVTVTANIWRGVLPMPQKDWTDEQRTLVKQTAWITVVAHHPGFKEPLVILMTVDFTAQQARQVVRGRWGIEQPPLIAKQLLGGHRQFVHHPQMCFRLPELIFVAGAALTYLAATSDPISTGWWDKSPKPTAGRLRRELSKVALSDLQPPDQLRKKNSTTLHLPKGFHPASAAARSQICVT
ncbi:MAG: hypothetical protein HC853_04750 [Anaerolineae bacterium]|nr:hypothetical protein [Anaerolineae bacterium]